MPLTLESSDSLSKISLEGEIDIGCAAELQGLLVHALGSSKEVQVSLGSATDLDVTAVQLIWAARRAASASAVEFAVTGPVSEPLASTLLQAGFEDFAAIEIESLATGT